MLYLIENSGNTLYSNNLTSGSTIYKMNIEPSYTGITLNLTYHNDRYTLYTLTSTGKTAVNYSQGKIYLPNDVIYNYSIYYTSGSTNNTVETGLLRMTGTELKPFVSKSKTEKKSFVNRG